MSLTGKRAVPANSHVGNNRKKHKPQPPTPPVRALQGLILNIRGITPAKWVAIQELPVFSSLDYIILTEHQWSAEFQKFDWTRLLKADGTFMLYLVLSRLFLNEDIEDIGTEVD